MFRKLGVFILLLAIAVTGVYGVTNYLANIRINALQEQNKELVDANNKYIALLAENKNLLNIAEKELDELKQDLNEAQTTIAANTEQIETLCGQVVQIETTIAAKDLVLAEKENTINALNNSLTASNERCDEITEELITANTQLSEAQKDIEANASEIEALELQISNLTSEKEALIVNIATKETTIANLTAEKTTIENEKQELQTTLTVKENKIAELEEEIANLDVAELQNKINAQEIEISELKNNIKDYNQILGVFSQTHNNTSCVSQDASGNLHVESASDSDDYIQIMVTLTDSFGIGLQCRVLFKNGYSGTKTDMFDFTDNTSFSSILTILNDYKEKGFKYFYLYPYSYSSTYDDALFSYMKIEDWCNSNSADFLSAINISSLPSDGYYLCFPLWGNNNVDYDGNYNTDNFTFDSLNVYSHNPSIYIDDTANGARVSLARFTNYSITLGNCHLDTLLLAPYQGTYELTFAEDFYVDTLFLTAEYNPDYRYRSSFSHDLPEGFEGHYGKIVYLEYSSRQCMGM